MRRRSFISKSSKAALLPLLGSSIPISLIGKNSKIEESELFFKISLNQWSLWNEYVGDSSADGWWSKMEGYLENDPNQILQGKLDPMDFPKLAREEYGLDAIEIEASLYYGQLSDQAYFKEFKSRCNDNGVKCTLLQNGWAGNLADISGKKSIKSIAANYHKWIDLANYLECPSVMVNLNGRRGDKLAAKKAGIEGLSRLVEYAEKSKTNILIENHGGFSADAQWLCEIIEEVKSPYCKVNVDFGNFCFRWKGSECIDQQFDPYQGVKLMMPHAKYISAKTIGFDDTGNDIRTDYAKMLKIVKESGYSGYIGIEWSGDQFTTRKEGIDKTKELLVRTGKDL